METDHARGIEGHLSRNTASCRTVYNTIGIRKESSQWCCIIRDGRLTIGRRGTGGHHIHPGEEGNIGEKGDAGGARCVTEGGRAGWMVSPREVAGLGGKAS